MRVWIDMTNSPHVPFFRPLIGLLEERGHEVRVSARDFAQTLELLDDCGDRARGRRAAPRRRRARRRRSRAMGIAAAGAAGAGPGRSGSTSRSPTPRTSCRSPRARSGIPSAYAYDYEFARAQHTLGSRAATRVVVPEAIPQERLDRLGAPRAKVRRYPGLKEEYYLSGFAPDPRCSTTLGLDAARVLVVVRTPPEVSLYHRHGNPLFARRARAARRATPPCRPSSSRAPRRSATRSRAAALPSLVVPEHAIDAQSLIALADLVVSAGGHDESRGGRARHAGVDDVRRAGWARSTRR